MKITMNFIEGEGRILDVEKPIFVLDCDTFLPLITEKTAKTHTVPCKEYKEYNYKLKKDEIFYLYDESFSEDDKLITIGYLLNINDIKNKK